MTNTLLSPTYPDAVDFHNAIVSCDLQTPHKQWLYWEGTVAGRAVRLKTYGRSYPQIFDVDGIRHGGGCDMKPRAFRALVLGALGGAA